MVLALAGDSTITRCLPAVSAARPAPLRPSLLPAFRARGRAVLLPVARFFGVAADVLAIGSSNRKQNQPASGSSVRTTREMHTVCIRRTVIKPSSARANATEAAENSQIGNDRAAGGYGLGRPRSIRHSIGPPVKRHRQTVAAVSAASA